MQDTVLESQALSDNLTNTSALHPSIHKGIWSKKMVNSIVCAGKQAWNAKQTGQ